MKILVFSGGGLAPALNPTLYGVIKGAQQEGWQIFGGLYGWASLLPGGKCIDITNLNVEPIKNHGGTFLRSSRTNPLQNNGIEVIKEKIKELDIDVIVAIGGDDTLGAAKKLTELGIPIVGIPKTIDNDLSGTYFTPGFPSAAHYLIDYVRQIKEDAAYALSRIYVIESLGMKAGWLAASSIYSGADMIFTTEPEIDLDKAMELLKKRYKENGNYAVVVVGQEAKFNKEIFALKDEQLGEQFNHSRRHFICLGLRDYIKNSLGVETKALYPGNYLESDKPIDVDRDLAIQLGKKAIELIKEKKFGFMSCIERPDSSKMELKVGELNLQEATGEGRYKKMPDNFYDKEKFLPTQEFLNYMEPILGKYIANDDDYTKLIKKINTD